MQVLIKKAYQTKGTQRKEHGKEKARKGKKGDNKNGRNGKGRKGKKLAKQNKGERKQKKSKERKRQAGQPEDGVPEEKDTVDISAEGAETPFFKFQHHIIIYK